MKAKAKVLLMCTMLMLSMIPLFANALHVPPEDPQPVPPTPPGDPYPPTGDFSNLVEWCNQSGFLGYEVWQSLAIDPEWLQIRTECKISHDTWIDVQGLDTYGQPVEGWCFIPEGTPKGEFYPLIDIHTGDPVTFANITGIFQQEGEHCNSFKILTYPEPYQEWLGTFSKTEGYKPNKIGGIPVEPSNPDPLKIYVNWEDDGDGIPEEEDNYDGAQSNGTIYIKGLDEQGNVLHVAVEVLDGEGTWEDPVEVSASYCGDHTWSDVSRVWGAEVPGDNYAIVTHPQPTRCIARFRLRIHRIVVECMKKDILANGSDTATIRIKLEDVDGNPIHWTRGPWSYDVGNWVYPGNIIVNIYASGGNVTPSVTTIGACETHVNVTITSDTNARSIKVTALAILPEVYIMVGGEKNVLHPEYQLWDDDYMTFDGVNSVQVPATKWVGIGGRGTGYYYEVYIKLYKDCNLISIPVFPEYDLTPRMLESTSANMCLISICWYNASGQIWNCYDFRTDQFTNNGNDPLVPGRGYWIKAEKPCTLVLSGYFYDQAPFVPPEHYIYPSWNLMGVTSLANLKVSDYLGPAWPSTQANGGRLLGPVWYWDAYWKTWNRIDPSEFDTEELLPTWGFWVNSYGTATTWIAP